MFLVQVLWITSCGVSMITDDRDMAQWIDGNYSIEDIVDLKRLRILLERFTEATGFTTGFLDHPGLNILIATGWRDICTKFHREFPVSAANCMKSNRHLLDQLDEPGKVVIESCDNGLVDCAIPIIIMGKHIATLATGQLLLEEPDVERFRRQAKAFGFDEHEYLEALKDVPVVSEEKLRSVTEFLGEMSLIISELGYTNLLIKEKAIHVENEIAERKRVEEGLKLSEEKYRFLAEKMADIVWTLDLDFRTTYVSPSVERVLGFTPEERKRQTIEEMIPPESLHRVQAIFLGELQREEEHIADPDRSVSVEVEYYRKDGSTIWMEITMKALRAPEGAMVGIYGVSRDISERKRAEEEKEKLQVQLVQAQKMESVGRLAGGVAHDFNNMLTVIIGRTELALKDVSLSERLRAGLVQIRNAAKSSTRLTRQLLAFARKQIMVPKLLDLNDTVASMLKMLRRLIGEHIDLVWMPGADLWPVKVDPGQIDQILANLCVNARDAITGVGKITIETENVTIDQAYCADHADFIPGLYVMLTVSDNGHGIEKDTINHLFEPFFTTKEVGHGTGLGLATVYGIVKQNEGFINVYSEPGKETAFQIYLPRSADKTVEVLNPPAPEMPQGRAETVLLVEDEKAVLDLVRALLEELGYIVLTAGTPGDALRLAEAYAGEIHLLLTDVVMPEMNGRDLAERVREIKPGLKCLFMSGYAADVITRLGVLDADVRFVQKPFFMRDLAVKVREALEHE